MIWFISDTHFNHDREFIYKPRGFHDINESNNTIIDNWNKNVAKEDEIYVLGDFFLGTDIDFIKDTISNLNGKLGYIQHYLILQILSGLIRLNIMEENFI